MVEHDHGGGYVRSNGPSPASRSPKTTAEVMVELPCPTININTLGDDWPFCQRPRIRIREGCF